MKKNLIIFLQAIIVFTGIAVLSLLIILPLKEGRAKDLDLFSIYADPFILYGYTASIAFFIGLYKAFSLLGYIGQNKVFSSGAVNDLKSIKYCGIVFSILIVMAAVYIRIFHHQDDDPAGFLAICLVTTFVAMLMAIVAAKFERKLQNAAEREKIIRNYVDAYNRFDIEKMLADLDNNIHFENIQDGQINLSLEGLNAFRQQAEQAKNYFQSRQQSIRSFKHLADTTAIEIDYKAVLAMNFPNGLKRGQELNLEGKSVFEFSGNKIIKLTDIS